MGITVECKGLSAGWGETPLLDGVGLDIRFADMHGCLPIVGRTGLGKSTLLYVLSGMVRPRAGHMKWQLPARSPATPAGATEVSWSGDTIAAFQPAARPRALSFGFLLQDAAMIPCFTVQDNLLQGMRLRGVTGSRKHLLERIRAAVTVMAIKGENVDHLLQVYPGRLSGGQRQRMALAAATVHDPNVLFADEPTASLDDETGLQVLKAIRTWLDSAATAGERAFVFVTHNIKIIRPGLGAQRMLQLEKRDGGPAERALVAEWREIP